jgi:serine/threonine protein kinase
MMAPIVTLLVASILLAGKRVLLDIFQDYRVELSESNLLLAQAFQSQGQFIKAFTRYRKCIVSDDVLEHLYYLGLDFEGKRQFIRASEVFRYIQTHKPANIIYDRDTGLATVTDFGVASLTDVSKTKTGMILGTPAFMSPEHLAGEEVDGRLDIFSLGVTLYQLLTGKLPFEANSLSSLMYKITNENPIDVCKIRPQLPRCTRQIVDMCLKKQPDKRLQKASLVASSLRRCANIIIASKVANSKRVSEAKLVD